MIERMLGADRLNADTYEEVESDRGAARQAVVDGPRRGKVNLGMIPPYARAQTVAGRSRGKTNGAAVAVI